MQKAGRSNPTLSASSAGHSTSSWNSGTSVGFSTCDSPWDPAADLDGNGIINGLDLTEVIANWTTAGAAASPAASEAAASGTEAVKPGRRGSGPGNVRRRAGNVQRK